MKRVQQAASVFFVDDRISRIARRAQRGRGAAKKSSQHDEKVALQQSYSKLVTDFANAGTLWSGKLAESVPDCETARIGRTAAASC